MKLLLLIVYIILGVLSALITLHDKCAAKVGGERVPESLLTLLAFLGGAMGMYIAMKAIRHKTKKPRFMLGLPIMIVFHVILLLVF